MIVGGFSFLRFREDTLRLQRAENPRRERLGRLTVWFDEFPDEPFEQWQSTGNHSNMRPQDYVDPQMCRRCHKEQHALWSQHSHRRMNLLADETSVLGDFSGRSRVSYLGGTASFDRDGKTFRMHLERDGARRTYDITETIGSRFFQYYVGSLVEGPDPPEHAMYHARFVLPFGYWLDSDEWVPVVHVSDEQPDGERDDPFDVPAEARNGEQFFTYSHHCSSCHSTFAIGDLLLRAAPRLGRFSPQPVHFSMPGYLADAHPQLWPQGKRSFDLGQEKVQTMMETVGAWEASEQGVSMGITCGACHMGAKKHAEGELKKPPFFPSGPHFFVETSKGDEKQEAKKADLGRNARNINAICARCHSGKRPEYAAGMSTWNSIEFADALQGACYSKLDCTQCHEPHTPAGKTWKKTAAEDDAKCLACHDQYKDEQLLATHTHHAPGSAGSRCLDCHMPRINEGLQDIVRTHLIYSPNESTMIEANEPNACNLCHTDKPITWTLKYLEEWYGSTYNKKSVDFSYPDKDRPVAVGWLKSRREPVRMVGLDCLVRTGATWALKDLLEALDDPHLLNRQFARRSLEKLLDRRFEDFGYRFYMTPEERREPLQRIREKLLPKPAAGTR